MRMPRTFTVWVPGGRAPCAGATATRSRQPRPTRTPRRRMRPTYSRSSQPIKDPRRCRPGSPRARGDEQLAGALEPIRRLVPREIVLDLAPGGLALGFAQPCQHLVQGSEGLAREADELGGGRQPQRSEDSTHLDIGEAGLLEGGLDHAGGTEAERAWLAWRRCRQLSPPADDGHRDREEAV